MNLTGLGYIAGGLSSGLDAGAKRAMEQLQAQALQQSQAGQKDAGQALMSLNGVQPQQPQGGLGGLGALLKGALGGGQPAQPPQAMPPQGQPPQQGAAAMPPQGQPPQAMPAQGQPPQQGGVPPQLQAAAQHLDFPTLTNTLAKAPGMTPERLMAALSALSPYMNMQSQLDFKKIQEQVLLQNASSRATSAGAAKENADTNAATRPITAGAAKERADTGAANEKSLEGYREGKLNIDQGKLDQGGQHLQMIEKAAAAKDMATAETNYRQLVNVRANAALAAHGDTNDPTVKGLDQQIKTAETRLAELRAKPQDTGGAKRTERVTPTAKSAPEGGAPPVEGARKAPDGNWYVQKDGKYYRVEQ